ncbi:MAG: hypothetical protein N2749_01440 [Clostridia bacterium]|nr:hypothetical protein [Clostridia bacterium]
MNKIRLCCFTVNSTHACIIANNFISNELSNVKVIYINEQSEKKKLKNIIGKFYKKMEDQMFCTEWLNEKLLNDYANETFVFVVNGKEEFVEKVNKYLDVNDFNGYVINCYEIFDIEVDIETIIKKHDYYINTTGIIKREVLDTSKREC